MSIEIRAAEPQDVLRLESIENAADALLVDLLQPVEWMSAPGGKVRASTPGFVLVAAEQPGGEAVGFVHVIEIEGFGHLEQLSVIPDFGRRGLGRALVEAAKVEARRRGFDSMTLRTYAEVPWNAPFYSTCGFVESEPGTSFHRDLVATEADLGLERYGRRIQMSTPLSAVSPA